MATADDPKRKNEFGDAAAASTNALVQQIPTGGNAPAPMGESASGSELGRNVSNLVNALPGAAGSARLVGGVGALGAGAISRLAAGSNAVRAVAPYVPPTVALAGVGAAAAPALDPPVRAPQVPAVSAPAATAPIQQPATPSAPEFTQGSAASPAPASGGLGIAGVQKTVGADGRVLYSDGNASSDASLMARGPISAQNMRAADNLAATSDAATAGRLQTQQYNAEVAQAQAINSRPFAGSGGTRGIRRAAGIGATEQGSIEGFNRARGADRFSRTLAVEQQRLGADALRTAGAQRVAEGRLALDGATAGLDARGRIQLLSAQDALAKATTPEARAAAEDTLRALQGRYERPVQNRFTVVPGGADEMGNRQASTVINNQTGEFVTPGQAKLPAGMTRQVGTSGGKPVYEDGSGKRFVGN